MEKISSNELAEIVRRLTQEFDPEQVILFGSNAWGDLDQGSDLDLLVIVSDSQMSPIRRSQRAHRCLRGLRVPKDILVRTRREVERYKSVHASLEAQIMEKGRVLYASPET